jgi:hypothetical protein
VEEEDQQEIEEIGELEEDHVQVVRLAVEFERDGALVESQDRNTFG